MPAQMRRLVTVLVMALLAAVDAAPASAGTANPWLERRVLNIAHQGGEDEFPSNTLYAFKKAIRAGADMLELDVGVTKDDHVVVIHDTSVDRTTNGNGLISELILREIQRLDAAYWFSANASNHYSHDLDPGAYRLRGVATGTRRPPKGFRKADFRIPTLREVLRLFPRTPINIEIKARTKQEEVAEYVYNAEVLARELADVRRDDLIVTSFQQPATDRFRELVPGIANSPGVAGVAGWVLDGTAPPQGTVAFQIPITFKLGNTVYDVTTPENVTRAHAESYAVHTWFGDLDDESPATWRKLVDWCVDGIMTSRPVELQRTLRSHRPPAACTHSVVTRRFRPRFGRPGAGQRRSTARLGLGGKPARRS
jgi:glycerophosphoryl diester phosphodiesterase